MVLDSGNSLKLRNKGRATMKDNELIDVPEYCGNCRHKLTGTEFMCPICGHCVISNSSPITEDDPEPLAKPETEMV